MPSTRGCEGLIASGGLGGPDSVRGSRSGTSSSWYPESARPVRASTTRSAPSRPGRRPGTAPTTWWSGGPVRNAPDPAASVTRIVDGHRPGGARGADGRRRRWLRPEKESTGEASMPEQALMSLDEIRGPPRSRRYPDARVARDPGEARARGWRAIKEAKGGEPSSRRSARRRCFARKQIQCRVLGLDFDYVAELVSLMIWHSKQNRMRRARARHVPRHRAGASRAAARAAPRAHRDRGAALRRVLPRRGRGRGLVLHRPGIRMDRGGGWGGTGSGARPSISGCATGQVAEFLQSRFARVRGFDVSPAMIEHARAPVATGVRGSRSRSGDLDAGIPVAGRYRVARGRELRRCLGAQRGPSARARSGAPPGAAQRSFPGTTGTLW